MAHDEGGLGIAAGLLVETFDRRHFAALFGPFEAIDQHHGAAVDPHQAATEQMLEGLSPELGQAVEVQGRGVKKVEQAVIAGVGKAQTADQTGDARQVRAKAQSGQHDHQPKEGGGPGTGWTEGLEGAQPGEPQEVRAFGKGGSGK